MTDDECEEAVVIFEDDHGRLCFISSVTDGNLPRFINALRQAADDLEMPESQRLH